MKREETLETTLGDLIVALTEEVVLLVQDEEEAHQLVADILTRLVHVSSPVSKRWH